ncbi:MAG: hypothetical protein AAFV47_01475 [Pseudomonadota bacterium]
MGSSNGVSFGLVWALLIVCALGLMASPNANSAAAWYTGKIQRVYLYHDGFIVRFHGTVLSDCIHNYAYFRNNLLGENTVDRAYAMALSAQQSNATFGIVLDITTPGQACNSNGSTDIKFD